MLASQFYNVRLRGIYREKYGIDVGLYSYGCFDFHRFDPNIKFGRYCSIADSVLRMGRNHPSAELSMHPFFYNKSLGFINSDTLKYEECIVEDDVWLGAQSIILPRVNYIGRGAVIAAGAIVTKDVPKYTIVAGNPAKAIGHRFTQNQQAWLEGSQWWLMEIDDLIAWRESDGDASFRSVDD